MASGGKRPGAGRPKATRTIEKERVMDYIAQQIAQNAEPLVEKLIEKAMEGDIMAIRELFDRGFGKAKQAVDVTSKGEQIGDIDSEAVIAAAKLYADALKQRKAG